MGPELPCQISGPRTSQQDSLPVDYANRSVRFLFAQIFANGFIPLPNLDKRCLFPAWQKVVVDQRQVNRWARSKRWPAIGLRIEPPLCVIDIDVLDPALVTAICQRMPVHGLARIGRPPKIAFFVRLEDGSEPFYRIGTRKFAPDITIEKPAWSAVEIFAGGGSGKQFGAYGPHEVDKDGRPVRFYQWPGASPADTHISALPTISVAQCFALIDISERVFEAAGWHVDRFTKSGAHRIDHVFDLTDEMSFEGEFESWDLDGLEAEARAAMVLGNQIKVTGSFTGDPYSNRSLRCRVGISPRFDCVYVHDFKTDTTHYPAALAGAPQTAIAPDEDGSLFDYTSYLGEPDAQGAAKPSGQAQAGGDPDNPEMERRS
jgi:hypothetical protein